MLPFIRTCCHTWCCLRLHMLPPFMLHSSAHAAAATQPLFFTVRSASSFASDAGFERHWTTPEHSVHAMWPNMNLSTFKTPHINGDRTSNLCSLQCACLPPLRATTCSCPRARQDPLAQLLRLRWLCYKHMWVAFHKYCNCNGAAASVCELLSVCLLLRLQGRRAYSHKWLWVYQGCVKRSFGTFNPVKYVFATNNTIVF